MLSKYGQKKGFNLNNRVSSPKYIDTHGLNVNDTIGKDGGYYGA